MQKGSRITDAHPPDSCFAGYASPLDAEPVSGFHCLHPFIGNQGQRFDTETRQILADYSSCYLVWEPDLKLVVSTCLSTDWPDRNRSRSTRIIEHDLMTRRYLNGGLWYGESSPNGLGPWWIRIYPKASWIITGWILSWRKGLKPELYTWKGLQPQNDLVWGKICRRRSFLPLNTQFLPTIFG